MPTTSPVHKPGSLKKWFGMSVAMKSFGPLWDAIPSPGPVKRYKSMFRQYEVLNAIFSSPQITNGGKKAHMNGARGDHAETSSIQP